MQNILDRLQPVFRDVLDAPELQVSRESTAKTVPGWDSLAHITLVVAIEGEFGVRFALGELDELKNVGGLVDLIAKKLGPR